VLHTYIPSDKGEVEDEKKGEIQVDEKEENSKGFQFKKKEFFQRDVKKRFCRDHWLGRELQRDAHERDPQKLSLKSKRE